MPHTLLSSLPLQPQALPSLTEIELDENGMTIWPLILEAQEDGLQKRTDDSPASSDLLVAARVVGFFVLVFWTWREQHPFATAYDKIISDIMACGRSDHSVQSIQELGLVYRNSLIRPFRQEFERTPFSTPPRFPPSFEAHREELIAKLSEFPKDRIEVKQEALLRDGYKCVITGVYDYMSRNTREPVIQAAEAESPFPGSSATQVAHLFPQNAVGTTAGEHALALMAEFGLEDTVERLRNGEINSLANVLTMNASLHVQFDSFAFWLEEVPGQPYTYDIIARYGDSFFSEEVPRPKRRITLFVHPTFIPPRSRELFELPDRALIAFRSACAWVAVMSGAADQEEEVLEEEEDRCVLSADGSDAGLLTSLLRDRVMITA